MHLNENVANKKLSIVTDSLIHLNASVSSIVRNQQYVRDSLNAMQAKGSKFNRQYVIVTAYSKLIYSLTHVSYLLTNLLTAVTFSKLNILHPSIISTKELLHQLQNINAMLPNSLILTPNLNNIESFEKIIQINAYHTNSRVVFLLNVPITTSDKYFLYHSYALPTLRESRAHMIIPTYKYFMVSESTYMFANNPCICLKSETFLCNNLDINIPKIEPCEFQLLQRSKPYTNCKTEIINTSWKIEEIENNSWLYFEPLGEIGKLQCPNIIRTIEFKGSYVIRLAANCSLHIHNKILNTDQSRTNIDTGDIPLLELPRITIDTKKKPVNITLDEIHLDDLHQLKSQLRNTPGSDEPLPVLIHSISTWTIILYTFLSVLGLSMGYRYVIRHRREPPPEDIELQVPVKEATLTNVVLR